MAGVRGIRGATTADTNSKEAILEATRELLGKLVEANDIDVDDVAAVYFTATDDLDAEFPPLAARQMGWVETALICGREMNVAGGTARCITTWPIPIPPFSLVPSNRNGRFGKVLQRVGVAVYDLPAVASRQLEQ